MEKDELPTTAPAPHEGLRNADEWKSVSDSCVSQQRLHKCGDTRVLR
eukprot:CAMPEP_0171099974 /NCGR_PEP_ID=MMETSP0766_2-20121228/52683_1 /TAXON_ID=439317 /ORGANISM="Gambierdiscus australes, Strain CAWD 149" /LENGTH=46 /DNA_ID= /DNA_START= /DNA_END= /DNA_ORIENTATION=